jgi:hypothetical protein
VFFATEKTGCTSVQNCLANLNDKNLIVGNKICDASEVPTCKGGVDIANPFNYKHTDCDRLGNFINEVNDYFKFAFVRNPWDRTVSWYFFEKSISTLEERDLTNVNFQDYIKNFESIWANNRQYQYEFTKCCDFIGRFENIQEDFNIICDKIKIPHQQLTHKNKSKHKHYTEYYDDETRKIVAEKLAKDIEYFNYKFGE